MNLNNPERVPKRKESVKKVSEESVASASSDTCREMDREMIVLPRQSCLEMEQKLKILSESEFVCVNYL